MYLKMSLQSERPFFQLPLHHNHLIQAALYDLLDNEFAEFLHNVGYLHHKGNRSFKLFSFSRLIGEYKLNKEEGRISFKSPVSLVVCSPIEAFCHSVMNAILKDEGIRIGQAYLKVTKIMSEKPQVTNNAILVRTLSPITVYSTFYRADGRKYTHYFSPHESDFAELVRSNLFKKYELVYKKLPPSTRFQIKPVNRPKQHVLYYKETIIKGYSGLFQLTAERPEVLALALDVSLGVKGSQGFGCIEMIRHVDTGKEVMAAR